MTHYLTSFNPVDHSEVGRVEVSDMKDIDTIVDAAHDAQKAWGTLSLEERSAKIVKAYRALEPIQDQLANLISLEMGKDYRRAQFEAFGTVRNSSFMVREAADALQSESVHGGQIQYIPLGVVGVISPWNYPLAMANNLMIPALVAGNTIVLKPSESTPLVADLFIRTLQNHFPKNVINIIHGDRETGQALVKSNINLVAFTGSIAAGRNIMENAAPKMKRLVMELGGNDPMIVMADADIRAAARFAVASSFENAGQMCTSTERIYVDKSVSEDFRQAVVDIAKHYQVGPWNQPRVNFGPLVNNSQHEKVVGQLKDAESTGARFLLGQSEYPPPYIQPTVVDGITPDMQLEREETFGPIVAMSEVESMHEAIERANQTIYGLGAVVFGQQNATDIAQQLDAGMVAVNGGVGGASDSPWVGAKQSGFGYHGSKAGHRQFAQVRVISL